MIITNHLELAKAQERVDQIKNLHKNSLQDCKAAKRLYYDAIRAKELLEHTYRSIDQEISSYLFEYEQAQKVKIKETTKRKTPTTWKKVLKALETLPEEQQQAIIAKIEEGE